MSPRWMGKFKLAKRRDSSRTPRQQDLQTIRKRGRKTSSDCRPPPVPVRLSERTVSADKIIWFKWPSWTRVILVHRAERNQELITSLQIQDCCVARFRCHVSNKSVICSAFWGQ
ncbi:hypothetical protein AVEN_145430-1 [Araneus ventricosus]|uniref:Uncharacterized protein n=1 Tax=Araneus ventricosus TaxID=182803 RepID=A0A4Y2MZW7_ARAVE|nr:hypothetical protein AVEN_145430-1 [Araneus ventricosus]